MRFSRQEYWNGLPCPSSGDLSDPRIKPVSLSSHALAGGFFTTYATRESHPHTYTQFFCFQFHFHYLIIILKFFKQCLKLLRQYLKTFINNILDTCLLFLHIADSLFNCFLDICVATKHITMNLNRNMLMSLRVKGCCCGAVPLNQQIHKQIQLW